MIAHPPPADSVGPAWWPPGSWGWPTLTVSFCVWLYNISRSFAVSAGYYLLQGAFLKLAWAYPAIIVPFCLGFVSLSKAYNDVTASYVLRFVSQVLINVTMHVGGLVAGRFGEPAGRVVTDTVTVYMALMALVLGFLAIGALTRDTLSYMLMAFARGFSWAVSPSDSPPQPPSFAYGIPPAAKRDDSVLDSDSGKDSRSSAHARCSGRRSCHAHCVWLDGKQVNAMQSNPCDGKRTKPFTPMYDEWFIQNGERVANANFPLTAELRTDHRLDGSEHKTQTKHTRLG